MSVASFVASSIDEYHAGRYDVALALACAAIDATATKSIGDFSVHNAERFKTFLENNMRIITSFGFPGIVAGGIRIRCRSVPDLRTDSDGYVSIADIIYHIVRCGLIHECLIDQRIGFVQETYIGDFDRTFRIPRSVIFGLLMAVILSTSNADQVFDRPYSESIGGVVMDLQSLWGRGTAASGL
jgi:hypothetical protein